MQTNEITTTTTILEASAPFAQPVEAGAAATEGLDVDFESAEAILSQLDYSIPTPPTFWWDDEFLGNALEATLASLDSNSFVVGVGDTGLSCSGLPLPDDIGGSIPFLGFGLMMTINFSHRCVVGQSARP